MTKQEQIEEMGKVMPEKIKDPLDNSRYIIFGKSLRREIARIYYNAGYRKVSADTLILTENQLKKIIEEEYKKALKSKVVLTTEEYQDLVVKSMDNFSSAMVKARKETAEGILNAVVGAIDNGTFFRKSFISMMNNIYGVEVEMANNDKTIEQANKKIVRQFYNKIQKMLDETRQVIEEPCNGRQNAGYCVADVDNGLKELAKQFGLEIKE